MKWRNFCLDVERSSKCAFQTFFFPEVGGDVFETDVMCAAACNEVVIVMRGGLILDKIRPRPLAWDNSELRSSVE